MLAVLRVCCCLAWLLLRCRECLPQQVTDRRGVDGQRPDTNMDAPTTGAGTMAHPMMEPVPPGAEPFSPPEGSSDAVSFLRELQAFLGNVIPLPPGETRTSGVSLQSLESLPSLALGPASSESFLVELLNSSSPTFFSFPPPGSVLRLGRGGALALPPNLLGELRRKLETLEQQMEVLMGEVEVEQKAVQSLERLKALSALPREEQPAGELQYRAFLLMLALQTVAKAYEVQRGLRAARGWPVSQSNICRVQAFQMYLKHYFLAPECTNIRKCTGVCDFPLHNPTNHAVLLNDLIQSGALLGSSVCCVPVAYESLRVLELKDDGTTDSNIKKDISAKECGCR